MPNNNTLIMMGLGLAALFMLRNQGGSQDNQVPQLAGAAMMATGEGTAPDAPFQEYSAPTNPVFFFNRGGQMAQVPGSPVPVMATPDEDIGIYPGGNNQPELEFTVARRDPPTGTTDISPTTPEFQGSGNVEVIPASGFDISVSNPRLTTSLPTEAIAYTAVPGQGISIFGATSDIATLSSSEKITAFAGGSSRGDPSHGFTTSIDVLTEWVGGLTGSSPAMNGPTVAVSQTGGPGSGYTDLDREWEAWGEGI